MNKTKMILAGTGGVIGLAVLVMGYLTWSAYSAKVAAMEGDDEEGVDGLETVTAKAQTLSRKAVYPCAASVTAIESNKTLVAAWKDEAQKLAMRGDKVFEKTTPAAFKDFIVADAKRLSALPGAVGGVLVKPEFAFGPFNDYIAGGKLPPEAQLAELQRKWDDVALVSETLAKCGIAELTDIQFKEKAAAAESKDGKKAKKSSAKAKPEQAVEPNAHSYVFTFRAKPVAFVKAVNALEVGERFTTVDDFSLSRSSDAIAEALGDDKKQAEKQATGGRRGRRRGAVEPEQPVEKKEASKNGIITDPLLDAPITVTMTATVYDFRSLEGQVAEEKGASK